MSRPRKCRRVCCKPEADLFGPINSQKEHTDIIVLTIEEYEAFRLIDRMQMTQEEAASFMNVARTTIQRLYNNARKKIAIALVDCKALKIEGGNYAVCNGDNTYCCNRACAKKNL